MSPRIRLAALATLMADALEDGETRHLANECFRDDLRVLVERVESELEERPWRGRLELVDETSVTHD